MGLLPSQEEEDFSVEHVANQVTIESSFASFSQVGIYLLIE